MKKYTAQAPTVEDAIEKALRELKIDRDSAQITVLERGKKGFLGIGQKDAVVTVEPKAAFSVLEAALSQEPLKEESDKKDSMEVKAEERDTQTEAEEKMDSESTASSLPELVDEKEKEVSEEAEQETDDEDQQENPEHNLNRKEQDDQAILESVDYIRSIASHMGADPVEVYVKQEGRRVTFTVQTEKAGIVIGRHGKVLNAIQSLVQIYLHKAASSKLSALVDVEGYRDRREETLFKLAEKTAERVNRSNRPVKMEPMPAHERKAIHRYLSDDPSVTTHSEGKEPHRYLVVGPAEERDFSDTF